MTFKPSAKTALTDSTSWLLFHLKRSDTLLESASSLYVNAVASHSTLELVRYVACTTLGLTPEPSTHS